MNYLTANGKSVIDLWLACLEDANALSAYNNSPHTRKPIRSADQYACTSCAQNVFQHLVYTHRAAIGPENFPASSSRPDCHWGRNCRTQQHNLGHAKRFNHICEQTRYE